MKNTEKVENKNTSKIRENLPEFISLMNVVTIKRLWNSDDKDVRNYLIRLVSSIVGFDISNFKLSDNDPSSSINQDSDIEYLTTTQIKFFFNRKYFLTLDYEGDFPISKFVKEKDVKKIINNNPKPLIYALEINFNGFSTSQPCGLVNTDYTISIEEDDINAPKITIHNLYLPDIKQNSYKNDRSENGLELRDLALFVCDSYEEMAIFAKGNKEREKVVEELKKSSQNERFLIYYRQAAYEYFLKNKNDRELYEEIMKKGNNDGKNELLECLNENDLLTKDIKKVVNLFI